MPPVSVEVHVQEGLASPLAEEKIEAAVRHVLHQEGVANATLSVALLDDAEISRLNAEYLDHEGPTDVISFPLSEPGQPTVGDVYIGLEQAERQADELGVDLAEEVVRLAVHGTLHVLGYDHPEGEDREASPMYRRQEELLGSLAERRGPGA